MIAGTCLCGGANWTFEGRPKHATSCNCTACRRFGVLWAYDYLGERIHLGGVTRAYFRGEASLGFHHCPECGCVTHWQAVRPEPDGRLRVAVNLRLADPVAVGDIPVQHLDALDSWERVARPTHTVRDMWF